MTLQERTYGHIDLVRQKTDGVLLFLSLGKDSLVLLDMIYPKFDRVVCVFMYFVKGLEHIERWIGWVKNKYPRIEFIQVPHWNLTYILRGGLYCVPNPRVKLLKLADVVGSTAALLKYAVNHPENTYIVATESGILHEMQKKCPQTTFIPAPPNDSTCGCNECSFMRLNTLEKLYECLKNEAPEITVDPEVAKKAVKPIQRMLDISAKLGL